MIKTVKHRGSVRIKADLKQGGFLIKYDETYLNNIKWKERHVFTSPFQIEALLFR